MNEVKRFMHSDQRGSIEVQRGKYVLYEDYTALQQQLTATTNSLTNAQEALKSAGIEADTVQAGVKELVSKLVEMQNRATESEAEAEKNLAGAHAWEKHARRATAERDALAAENALMLADYRDIPEMRRIGAPLTPATDAYLNAVRAEGVDKAIEHLHNKFTSTGHVGVPVMALEWLATQLRSGNAGKDGV